MHTHQILSASITIIYPQHLLHSINTCCTSPHFGDPTLYHQIRCTASLKYDSQIQLAAMSSPFFQSPQLPLFPPPMQHSHHQLHPVLISFTSLNHTQLFSHTYTFSACSIAALLLHTFSISQLPFINSQLILSFLFFTPRLTARLTRPEVSRVRQPWHIGYCLHGVALGADGWGNTIGPLLAWHSCLAKPRHSRA